MDAIMEILELSENQYNNLVLDSAFAYLNKTSRTWDKPSQEFLRNNPRFWKYWFNRWEMMDAEILYDLEYGLLKELTVAEYKKRQAGLFEQKLPTIFWKELNELGKQPKPQEKQQPTAKQGEQIKLEI